MFPLRQRGPTTSTFGGLKAFKALVPMVIQFAVVNSVSSFIQTKYSASSSKATLATSLKGILFSFSCVFEKKSGWPVVK